MKKNTKGFTLIELLAVIVILAIIALIAVPIIMNIINKANKSAFKDSSYGVISAGELYYAEQVLEPNGMQEDVTMELPDSRLQLKGEVPTGSILITKEGKVAIAVHNNRYCITKGIEDKDVTITEDIANCNLPSGEVTPPAEGDDSGESGGSDNDISVAPKADLNDYTWAEIQIIAKSTDNLNDYGIQIGDTKEYEGKTYYLVSDERNESYDGLVFMYNSYLTGKMNDTATNVGGYINGPDGSASTMKKTVDGIYNTFPTELKSVIKAVTIKANDGHANYTKIHTTVTPVYLFLPSVREMGHESAYSGHSSLTKDFEKYLDQEGTTFDWFANPDTEVTNRKTLCNSYSLWLRSADGYVSEDAFLALSGAGTIFDNCNATSSHHIAPVFVIG